MKFYTKLFTEVEKCIEKKAIALVENNKQYQYIFMR